MMSGLLLCNKQSENPYYIGDLDINVYSIEEISYFLYNHIYLVGSDFFNLSLVDYINDELELTVLASKLKVLIDLKAAFNDMVLLVLKESDYYNDQEIKEISIKMLNLGANSLHKRMKARADIFSNCNKYFSALNEYKKILEMKKEADLPDKFYANVLYDLGVIYIRIFFYPEAEKHFLLSYELYKDEETLKKIILTNLIQDNEENLLNNIKTYNIDQEVLRDCKQEFLRVREEAQNQEEHNQLKELLFYDGTQDIDAYYKGIYDTLDKWKAEYRELMI